MHSAGHLSYTITDDTGDWNDISVSIEQPIPADLMDTDAPEDQLYGSFNASMSDQLMVNETPSDLRSQPDQAEVGDQADVVGSESVSAVEVEEFPFGRPGAPIPGRAQDPSEYESQAASVGSAWAPFLLPPRRVGSYQLCLCVNGIPLLQGEIRLHCWSGLLTV